VQPDDDWMPRILRGFCCWTEQWTPSDVELNYLTRPNSGSDQSCPWVGLTDGLGRVGSRFFQFSVGRVGSTIAIVLEIRSAKSALSRLTDNICIGSGRIQFFPLVMVWVGLGQSADGSGWIGSHKSVSISTLFSAAVHTGSRRTGSQFSSDRAL